MTRINGRRRPMLLALLAVAALLGSLAACSSSTSSGKSSGQKKGGLTVGYVSFFVTGTPEVKLVQGMKAALAPSGGTVKVSDSKADAGQANSQMQLYVNQKVNAIVLDTYDPSSLTAGLQAAKEAKIPVYLAFCNGNPTTVALCYAQNAGAQETQRMISDAGGRNLDVLAFTVPGGANCVAAEKAFDAQTKSNSAIKVTKFPINTANSIPSSATETTGWLRSHPAGGSDQLAIWSCYDDGPNVGATSALTSAGRSDVKVYGEFAASNTLQYVKQGKETVTYWFDSVALGKEIAGYISQDAAAGYANIKTRVLAQQPTVIDKTSVDAFLTAHPDLAK